MNRAGTWRLRRRGGGWRPPGGGRTPGTRPPTGTPPTSSLAARLLAGSGDLGTSSRRPTHAAGGERGREKEGREKKGEWTARHGTAKGKEAPLYWEGGTASSTNDCSESEPTTKRAASSADDCDFAGPTSPTFFFLSLLVGSWLAAKRGWCLPCGAPGVRRAGPLVASPPPPRDTWSAC